jgi:hypothetical protein
MLFIETIVYMTTENTFKFHYYESLTKNQKMVRHLNTTVSKKGFIKVVLMKNSKFNALVQRRHFSDLIECDFLLVLND